MSEIEPVGSATVAAFAGLLADTFATTAKAEITTQGMTRETLAARMGVSLDRLAEILPSTDGARPQNLTLEDMAATMAALGVACRVSAFGQRARVRMPAGDHSARTMSDRSQRSLPTPKGSRHGLG